MKMMPSIPHLLRLRSLIVFSLTLIGLLASRNKYVRAFYVPGVNPEAFREGDQVKLKVNKMTSTRTLMPLDYYILPQHCAPEDGPRLDDQNLGEFLAGDRIKSSKYYLAMKQEMYCEQLCISFVGRPEQRGVSPNKMVKVIRKNYHNNWIVDNLPAASKVEDDESTTVRYWQGFPIGFIAMDTKEAYIHNHVNIEIMYHAVETETDKYRVVGFTVEPFSIKHEFEAIDDANADINNDGYFLPKVAKITNPTESCRTGSQKHTTYDMITSAHEPQLASGKVLFTYDVIWFENKELHWASRWDIYLKMDDAVPAKVHWINIVNSFIVIVVLSAIIVAILVWNLRSDLNDEIDAEVTTTNEETRSAELEEKGWKSVPIDLFQPPRFSPMLLAVCCGTGAQLLCAAFTTIIFASMGFFSPARRGHLTMFILYACVLMGIINGYVTARFHKMFKGVDWKECAKAAASLFPGLTITGFLFMDAIYWWNQSSGAVPFVSLLILAGLFFIVFVPLVYVGAYFGYRQDAIQLPEQPQTILLGIIWNRNAIRKSCWKLSCAVIVVLLLNVVSIALGFIWLLRRFLVKRNCWSSTCSGVFTLLVGGALAFGILFVELYYILASVWLDYYYYVFGFLFLVFCIVTLTCAEVAILLGYFQLASEEYFSWWWQFFYSGAVSIWVFLYSFIFYQIYEADSISTHLLYFGFMAWVALALLLMMGFVGVVSSLWFVKTIVSTARNCDGYQPLVSAEDEHFEYAAMELSSPTELCDGENQTEEEIQVI